MRSFFKVMMVMVMFAFVGRVFADCVATKDQCEAAWKVKREASSARDGGNFDKATKKYIKAASLHPMEVYKAYYLMNAVGCLLSSKLDPGGNYVWDPVRGPANAVQARGLLDEVQSLLSTVQTNNCSYDSGVIEKVHDWYTTQVTFLNSQVPPSVPVVASTPVAVVTPAR